MYSMIERTFLPSRADHLLVEVPPSQFRNSGFRGRSIDIATPNPIGIPYDDVHGVGIDGGMDAAVRPQQSR